MGCHSCTAVMSCVAFFPHGAQPGRHHKVVSFAKKQRQILLTHHAGVGYEDHLAQGEALLQRRYGRIKGLDIGRIAGKELISYGQTLRCLDERQHHLHPVRLAVLTVTLLSELILTVRSKAERGNIKEEHIYLAAQEARHFLGDDILQAPDTAFGYRIHHAVKLLYRHFRALFFGEPPGMAGSCRPSEPPGVAVRPAGTDAGPWSAFR